MCGKDFSDNGSVETSVPSLIDLPHPTRADHREDFVGADSGRRDEAHWRWSGRIICAASARALGDPSTVELVQRFPILPRSLHLPRASTDGSARENVNKTGVRLWT
jgi:hypothetical protein